MKIIDKEQMRVSKEIPRRKNGGKRGKGNEL